MMGRGFNLENLKSFQYWPKWATPYLIPYLSVLNQNKALHSFQKWGSTLLLDALKKI